MRLIDKDALLSDIERTIEESGCVNHESEIMDCIEYAPTIDAVPVVRGKWIKKSNPNWPAYYHEHCSICGWENAIQAKKYKGLNYCPNCGTKMEDES